MTVKTCNFYPQMLMKSLKILRIKTGIVAKGIKLMINVTKIYSKKKLLLFWVV